MSDVKPLSGEERETLLAHVREFPDVECASRYSIVVETWDATVRAAEARADAERERAEALRAFVAVVALDPDSPYAFKAREALADDDRHRAAQGEGT